MKTLESVIINYWLKFYNVNWEENKFLTLKNQISVKALLQTKFRLRLKRLAFFIHYAVIIGMNS